MKVILLNGSPHVDGCTKRALLEVEKSLNKEGIDTEIIEVGSKSVHGCIACKKCSTNGKCIFDDVVNEIALKLKESAGIVVGTPVYYAGVNGTLKSCLDRLFYSTSYSKTMKVGAAVISSRRTGSTSAFDEINKYFTINSMPIVSSTYWNEVHGFTKDDVEKDLEGLQTMRNLGKNMAFLIKSINLGEDNFGIPEQELKDHTNFSD